jgi:hypothetical protein
MPICSSPVGNSYWQASQIIPQGIQNIATEFIALQEARHQADYDSLAVITQAQAQTDVTRAELVFLTGKRCKRILLPIPS